MRTALASALLICLGGCGATPTGFQVDLPGSSWTLERVVRTDGSVARGDGDQVTFAADGSLALSSCNACSGEYSVRGDVLSIEAPLACTKRACAPGAVELERVLGTEATLRREGVYLIAEPLTGDAEQVLFVPAGR